MRRISVFVAAMMIGSAGYAWSTFTHQLVAEASLKAVAKDWHLEEPVIITPFNDFLKKLSKEKPEIQNRGDFARWLQINPNSFFDRHWKEEKDGASTTPFHILAFYATRPDDKRDSHLPWDRLEQFWFGATENADTQAFRHMEKPAFDLRHPLNTSGFPLGSIGQATERSQIYFDLALLADKLGEPYWAWNFLGCALHYVQDLYQPYHATQLPIPLAWESIRLYFNWGRKKGFTPLHLFSHVTSNTHHYFEGYVEYILRGETKTAELWIQSLQGKSLLPEQASIKVLAKQGRDFANHFVVDTIRNTFLLTGNNLKKSDVYRINDLQETPSADPTPFLNPIQEERNLAASNISQIILADFQQQGKAVRSVVRAFIDRTRKGE